MNAHFRINIMLIGIMTALALLLAGPVSAKADDSLALGPEWEAALEPLRSMPVQDYGFIRSGYTFGESHVKAITGRGKFKGADGLELAVQLMADPMKASTLPLLKVSHPDLVKMFGSPRISLMQYRSHENHEKLFNLVRQDQDKWLKPLNEIEAMARSLEELENDFAILPREKEWLSPAEVTAPTEADAILIGHWEALKAAVRANDPAAGAQAAAALSAGARSAATGVDAKMPNLDMDVRYHQHAPFKKAAYWYVFAALVYLFSYLLNKPRIAWAGYGLLAVGLVEQAVGIGMRWILSGRAPLSDMFESFTFAIGGMVLVALIFEAVQRTRLVGLGSAVLGFVFMVLAHQAPIFNSEIRPLMPALQSSWLTYHVVTIMLSYSAFALSAFVGVAYLAKDYLFKGDGSRNVIAARLPKLESMDVFNYRIIGVGFPLLTLGIVFGAVWAATAWGRPWGFDPKETWSAITWLIYAIYLHVRYLAGWKGRRAAVLSVIGFAAVLFTYLGVNYLLPGLHSYA